MNILVISVVLVSSGIQVLGNLKFQLKWEDEDNNNNNVRSLHTKGSLKNKMAIVGMLKEKNSNFICSPASTLLPLAKLAVGAEGKTLDELESAIGFKKSKFIDVIPHYIKKMRNIPHITLNMVSKIYLSHKFRLKPSFQNTVLDIFDSEIGIINFESSTAANKINTWVEQQTGGHIKKIVSKDDLKEDTAMVLLCAVYFKANWQTKFDQAEPGTFHSSSGLRNVYMMSKVDSVKYKKSNTLDAKIISLPYKGGVSEFVIVLPNSKTGLNSLLNTIKSNGMSLLREELKNMPTTSVNIQVPKFKIMTDLDLKPLLKKLHVKRIFKKTTDLSRMVDDEFVYVTKAVQKSLIDVDEIGTSAASVTSIDVVQLKLMQAKANFIANHPFLFYIMVKGEQLFAGIYNGPRVEDEAGARSGSEENNSNSS